MTGVLEGWRRFWYAPIDPIQLAGFRQAFLWTMLIYFGAWSFHAQEWLTPLGYHPDPALDPRYAPQLPLLAPAALPFVGVVFFGCLLADIFGVGRRLTIWVLLAAAIYAMLVDPISAFTINRLFVIGLLILAIAPQPEGEGEAATQIAWPTRMLQLTVIVQYFAAGLCKVIRGDWLHERDVLWSQLQGVYMTDFAAWLIRELPSWAWVGLEQAALWFELLAPLLFGLRRLRPWTLVIGLAMHLVIALAMDQLIYFSLQMVCFYVLFVPPERLRKLVPDDSREGAPTSA